MDRGASDDTEQHPEITWRRAFHPTKGEEEARGFAQCTSPKEESREKRDESEPSEMEGTVMREDEHQGELRDVRDSGYTAIHEDE